jgi:hypothetical protein
MSPEHQRVRSLKKGPDALPEESRSRSHNCLFTKNLQIIDLAPPKRTDSDFPLWIWQKAPHAGYFRASESVIWVIETLHFTPPLHPSSISGLGIDRLRTAGLRLEVKNK